MSVASEERVALRRVAVVNRGEAATRFMKSAHLANPPVEAVLLCLSSELKGANARLAPHVVVLGDDPSAYEDPVRVLNVALKAGCDSAWLGWGFASERASFVRALEEGGLTTLTPRPDTLELLGDKGRALMVASEVGFDTGGGVVIALDEPLDEPLDQHQEISGEGARLAVRLQSAWQVALSEGRAGVDLNRAWLLKATEGGGGRGIYELSPALLNDLEGLKECCEEHVSAVQRAGWPLRFVFEPLAHNARHLEAQLLGDGRGGALVVGLRDCSAQRRRQKLIEECPPYALPTEVAASLEHLALELARHVRLRSAATLEALYEPESGALRFLEVNPRLQVEHPVTEEVYGLDLILAQLMIARGEGLPTLLPPRGAALEARVYAEDPARAFAPAPGTLRRFRLPSGPGVRVDTGFEEGDVISPLFDPLVAKLIAWGPTRDMALARLRGALNELQLLIEGGEANHRYLAALLEAPEFTLGQWHTQRSFLPPSPPPQGHYIALINAALDRFISEGDLSALDEGRHAQRGVLPMEVYRLGGRRFYVSLTRDEFGGVVEVEQVDNDTRLLTLFGHTHYVQRLLGDERAWVNGEAYALPPTDTGLLRAPSMGAVLAIERGVGARFKRGEVLLTLESMKVEVRVEAPCDGLIKERYVEVGALVRQGQPLLELTPLEDEHAEPHSPSTLGGTSDSKHMIATLRAPYDQTDMLEEMPEGRLKETLEGRLKETREETLESAQLSPLIQATCEGWDIAPLPKTLIRQGARLLSHEQACASLERFIDLASLFDRRPKQTPEGREGATYTTHPQLLISALLKGALNEEQASAEAPWRALLLRALTPFGVRDLKPSHELKEALLRLKRAQGTLRERADVAQVILEELSKPPRALLDRLLSLDPERFPALVSLANSCALEGLSEASALPLDERALSVALRQLREPSAPLWRVAVSPDRLLTRLLARSLEGDATALSSLARVLGLTRREKGEVTLTRTLGGLSAFIADLGLLISADLPTPLLNALEEQPTSAQLTLPQSPSTHSPSTHPKRLAWLCLHPLGLDVALNEALELNTSLTPSSPNTWRSPQQRGALTHRLNEFIGEFVGGDEGQERPHELWLIGLRGEGGRAERLTRDQENAWVCDELARDLTPGFLRRAHLPRLERFSLTRVPISAPVTGSLITGSLTTDSLITGVREGGLTPPPALALYQLTAHDNPQDVRLFAYTEVYELKRGRGRPLSIPQVDQVFYEALKAMHEALKRLDPQRRLHWNRLVIRLRPVVPLGVEVIKRYVTRLSPRARWVGLEKLVVRARFKDPQAPHGVSPLMDLSVGELLQPTPSYALRPTSRQPLTPRSPFESSVVAARRRGLIHPQDVIYLLEGGGSLPRGKVSPLWQAESEAEEPTSVSAFLVETPCSRPRVTLRRALLISDPTLRMGALSTEECAVILKTFDIAQARSLPVEWVSVSAGARIDWKSGTENLDACAAVLKRIIEFNDAGGQVNVIVPGVCVGAQSYWNAEATMLMSSRGLLIMTDKGAMVLTGKRALELSGCVSAQDELELGGYAAVMGPNGQAQSHAPDLPRAYQTLYRFYQLTYRPAGACQVPPTRTKDSPTRDLSQSPYPSHLGHGVATLGELISPLNQERKRPFAVRPFMQALLDSDAPLLERWGAMEGAETAVVWHGRLQGRAITLIGIDNQPLPRVSSADEGPRVWSGGTLYPQASRKVARALNASRGVLPVVILANLSGFDGSPESLRQWQLEYGAEIARAVVRFDQPLYFVVLSRYHGGAYVVFSKQLNPRIEVIALEGSFASVIGGGPAASIVFSREVKALAEARGGSSQDYQEAHAELSQRFDHTHNIDRAQRVGSIDTILPLSALRAHLARALSDASPT